MKLAALCSGGKDSTFSVYKVLESGHTVECLVTIHPSADDSMLFHFPNNNIAKSVAEAYAHTIYGCRFYDGFIQGGRK